MFSQPMASLRGLFAARNIAIDLGTENTRVCARGCGYVAEEASVVERRSGAMELPALDEGPVKPVRGGVVVDVEAAALLLRAMVGRMRRLGLGRPGGIVCSPTDADRNERRALTEAVRRAGISVIGIAPEPLAAALGGGLDISSPYAQMLVDIGGGVTDIAVIRSRRVIHASAVRMACSDLHAAVTRVVAGNHGVGLCAGESERLVAETGALCRCAPEHCRAAAGIETGGRRIGLRVSDQELREAIDPVLDRIVARIAGVLRDLPEQTAVEVIEDGIWLTGGGACIPGMSDRIALGTTLDVRRVSDPLHAVVRGAALMLGATQDGRLLCEDVDAWN